jgi:hypothetical protein
MSHKNPLYDAIRKILMEEHNIAAENRTAQLTPEQAERSFCNRRLDMAKQVDPRTFARWEMQANQRMNTITT